MHVEYTEPQRAKNDISKGQHGPLELSLDEVAILTCIKVNPNITLTGLSEKTGKSERTVKRRIADLRGKGIIRRENGRWVIL